MAKSETQFQQSGVIAQRTPEWFAWRNLGIGSSDAGVLFGMKDEYGQTVKDLWLQKTGQLVKDSFFSPHADRGTRMEDAARLEYIRYTGNQVEDILCIHPKYSFCRASLDGWVESQKLILEIKCPKNRHHYRAVVEGYIQPMYYAQIQHQFLASGGKLAHYWSFDGVHGHLLPFEPDYEFMGELLEREIIFWDCVVNKTEPNPKDFRKVA